jgi:hypothetical protein
MRIVAPTHKAPGRITRSIASAPWHSREPSVCRLAEERGGRCPSTKPVRHRAQWRDKATRLISKVAGRGHWGLTGMRNRVRSAVAHPTACPPNTGDKLRGARSRTLAHGGSATEVPADYHAAPRDPPPLVSFIALFDCT